MGRILDAKNNIILVESINYNGQLEIVEVSGSALRSVRISELAETRFKLFKNKGLKTVDSVNTPETNTEKQLQRQEYENKHTAGIDSTPYHYHLGKTLKKPGVNPFYTHVEDVAKQAPAHIQHTRREIIRRNKQVKQKLAILDALEIEATLKIQSESANYNWWISLNERLSFVVRSSKNITDPNLFTEQNYELSPHAKNVLQLFPHVIALPTIHRQGIFASNRFTFQGIVPITLFDTSSTQSFSNGLISITTGYGSTPKRPEIAMFHDYFIQEVINLKPQERKAIETAYYLLTRANSQYDNLQLSDFTNIEKTISRMTRNEELMLRLTKYEDMGNLLSLVSLYEGNRLAELESKFEDTQLEVNYMSKLFSDFAKNIIKQYQIQENS